MHFPDNVLTALKDAVYYVFWSRKDLKSLFRRCDVPQALMNQQDWDSKKHYILTPVIDTLNQDPSGLGPLRRILQETLQYQDGEHLLWMSDGRDKKREAERRLNHLRLLVKDHDAARRTEDEERRARLQRAEEARRGATFHAKLDEIRGRFIAFHADSDRRARGYGLEEILYDLFALFELDPRGPFCRTGEQIDGAFSHEGDHFLLEAKWQDPKKVNLAALRDLDGAVNSSLDNTLGLFVSLNGYSPEAIPGYLQGNRPRIICMDGGHLMTVLEGRISLDDLLRRMRELAVQKRMVYVPIQSILTGSV